MENKKFSPISIKQASWLFSLGILLIIVSFFLPLQTGKNSTLMEQFVYLNAVEFALVTVVIAAFAFSLKNRELPIRLNPIKVRNIPLLVIYAWSLIPISLFLSMATSNIATNAVEASSESLASPPAWITIISAAIIAPLVEEFMFRGILYESFSYKKESKLISVLLVSFLFGLLHMNLNQFLYATFVGFFLCLAVEATDSIWGGVITHAAFNFTEILVFLSSSTETTSSTAEVVSEVTDSSMGVDIAFFVVVVVAIAFFLGIAFLILNVMLKINGTQKSFNTMFKPSLDFKNALQYTPILLGASLCVMIILLEFLL